MTDAATLRPATTEDVARAAARLAGIAHRTPVLTSRTADQRTGGTLFFKCENLQRVGAFKFRGAVNAVAALPEAARRRGVVAFSSGNHAQAVALACRLADVPATIVMPHDAPALKIAATRGYGATIRFYDRDSEDREAISRALAGEHGYSLIPPYDHPDVAAGQGTAAMELFEEVGALDLLLVCLGGGGLLAGSALAARQHAPACRVVGVEPEAGDDGQQSFRAGRIVTIPTPATIADGARTTHLGTTTFPVIRALVSDIVTVPDASLVEAMRFFAERMKMIVEPTGCLAAAAALDRRVETTGLRIGVILSGGNVDLSTFARLVGMAA